MSSTRYNLQSTINSPAVMINQNGNGRNGAVKSPFSDREHHRIGRHAKRIIIQNPHSKVSFPRHDLAYKLITLSNIVYCKPKWENIRICVSASKEG